MKLFFERSQMKIVYQILTWFLHFILNNDGKHYHVQGSPGGWYGQYVSVRSKTDTKSTISTPHYIMCQYIGIDWYILY